MADPGGTARKTAEPAARRTLGARTGGRSERVVRQVLDAAIDELARVGYAALRTDEVAARAEVAKTTVYRRWPTKAALVEAAVREMGRFDEDLPDTGSVRDDLVRLVQATVGRLGTPRARAIARLVTNEGGDPEVDLLARRIRDERRRSHASVVERAQLRGELPADVDPALVVEVVLAPVYSRVVRFGELPTAADVARIVDLVLTGAKHGGGARAPAQPSRTRPR